MCKGNAMAATFVQPSPSRTDVQLLGCRTLSSQPRSSSGTSGTQAAVMLVKFRHVPLLCFNTRFLGHKVRQKSSTPRCTMQFVSTFCSTELPHLGCERIASKEQQIFVGGYVEARCSTSPGNSSLATFRRVPTAGFNNKFKKGVKKVGRKRTKLEERLQKGFQKVGLQRQFGELPEWSAYVPLVAGGLETLVIVGWSVYAKGDLKGSSTFNLSGEGLLTLLLGTNFAIGWLASQMSTWRVQALSPTLLGRGKKAARPGIIDFMSSFVVNIIPYGNFLAWTRFAWKESNSVSSINALVYVVPSLVRLVLWSQGLAMGKVELLAWVLGAIHRPYDAARVKNEKLLDAADAKIESARKAKEEKDQREKGPELTMDDMVLLQQRKELEEFDILLARSTNASTSIPGPPSDWSVGDTAQWLAQQGFARYASSFVDNDIDGAILLLLTEEDLRDELGIQSLGDRKKLIQVIQRLR
ncbi:unnamed protein product [Calypogeia fissa]